MNCTAEDHQWPTISCVLALLRRRMLPSSLPKPLAEFEHALVNAKASDVMPGSIFLADNDTTSDLDGSDAHADVAVSGGSEPHASVATVPTTPVQSRTQNRRRAFPPEILVMVRPSGRALQQHPHNLQVQLLSPIQTNKARSPEPGVALSRSSSRGSDQSTHSGKASSQSSKGTLAPGNKITPLYNLDLHNIRATTIADASTEQRVAKVTRKGIELEDFGTLHPQELIFGVNDVVSSYASAGLVADQTTAAPTVRPRLMERIRHLHEKKRRDAEKISQGRSRSQSSPPVSQSHPGAVIQMTPGAGCANGHVSEGYFWEIKQLSRAAVERDPSVVSKPVATLDKIWSRFNALNLAGAQLEPPPPEEVPVRFEWVRDVFTDSVRETPAASPAPSPDGSPASRASQLDDGNLRRTSELSHDILDGSSWTCSIVLGEHTYIPIGHLTPVQHHPMLVAQLVLPYPLPDLSYSGLAADGLGFTREELKDIVVTTALHLAIREAMDT